MLEEKIMNDYKQAMKDKDSIRSSILSLVRAEMMNLAIAKKKKELNDEDAISVIRKQVKQHQDSIEQFRKGNRQDLVDKEQKELEILKCYLPAEIPAEELNKIIAEAISSTAASGMKDMGRVMKEVSSKVAGRADVKTVSDIVRARLSNPPA